MERRAVYERGLVGLFFLVLAVAGVLVYDEYGIAWDEPGIVEYGNLLLDHYAPGGEWESFINLRYYGPVGPVALALADRLTDGPAFPPAHLANFAFFFAGAYAFYALCRFQFGSRMWGLLGAALLVLSPRVLSHAFVNPKDMPLMVMFVVAMYFLVRFLDSDRRRWIVLCGVATAFAMGVRITAAFLIALAVAAVAVQALARRKQGAAPRAGVSVGIYLLVSTALTIAIWPWLWENPVTHFYEAAQLMSNFDEGPLTVLHFGKIIGITELPWDYLPVWIGITTPPAFLLLMVVGLASIRWKRGLFKEGSRDRFFFLYLAWAFIPLVAIAVLRTPLYDEWRQAMFVYPPLLMFAVAGTRWIARATARSALPRPLVECGATVLAATLIWSFGTVVRFHPYQAAYFNVLAGDRPQEDFDVDYWGLSYKEALERVLNIERGEVQLYTCGPGRYHVDFLDPELAARINFVGTQAEAQYTICAPRVFIGAFVPEGELLFTIERDGIPLLVAHRRH